LRLITDTLTVAARRLIHDCSLENVDHHRHYQGLMRGAIAAPVGTRIPA
jgi:hypothetical protein